MLSFVIGVLLGVLFGFVLARFSLLAEVLDPYIQMLNSLPRVVLAPIFMLWFGLGIWSKVALGVTLVFFVVFFNTYRGVREVDRVIIDNARMLGASERQLLRHVLIPRPSRGSSPACIPASALPSWGRWWGVPRRLHGGGLRYRPGGGSV